MQDKKYSYSHLVNLLPFSQYLIAFAALIIMATYGGMRTSFGVFFKPIMYELGWTRALISGASSLTLIIHGFASILSGYSTDRFGARIVLTGCGIFMGTGYMLMSQLSERWHLYLFLGIVVGIGNSIQVPILSTLVRRFPARRGLMTGFAMAGIGVGQIIIPLIATLLIYTCDWRLSYIILGAISFLLMTGCAQFFGQMPPTTNKDCSIQTRNGSQIRIHNELNHLSITDVIRTKEFWIIVAMQFSAAFCIQSILVHLVPYITDVGIGSTIAAGALSVIGIAMIVGTIVLGNTADKIGEDKIYPLGFVILIISLVGFLFSREGWSFYLSALCFGFAMGFPSLASVLLARIYGLKIHGTIFSITNLSFDLGAALSPYIFGYLYDITHSYQGAFLTDTTFALIGLILSMILILMNPKGRVPRAEPVGE